MPQMLPFSVMGIGLSHLLSTCQVPGAGLGAGPAWVSQAGVEPTPFRGEDVRKAFSAVG